MHFPAKQVHLDFHTSELIEGVGSAFSKENFQEALKLGRLDSITLFAKCHHGWCYYPSGTGRVHPHLDFDLLGAQIEAAHEIGVRTPVYLPVGWSALDAKEHPEWVAQKRDGSPQATGDAARLDASPDDPRPPVSWLCLYSHPDYVEYLLDLTREVAERYPIDGLFYDIVFNPACVDFSESTLRETENRGLDPDKDADVLETNRRLKVEMAHRLNAALREKRPEPTVFYNGKTQFGTDDIYGCFTHFELEDLPTFWGGYDKLPLNAKYFSQRDGKGYLAMSGKFHTMWGEFGGFKHPDAITYEVAHSVALGAGCSFGDQLHPNGRMELATYRNIGAGYDYLDRIAEYGLEGEFHSDLGLLLSGNEAADRGVAKMLLEEHLEFEIADPSSDWTRFRALVIPDGPTADKETETKLREFVENGGAVLALHEALLARDRTGFHLPCGAAFEGDANYRQDYTGAAQTIAEDLPDAPFLNYESGIRARLEDGAESLGTIHEPYFDRTYARYSSHRNTPYRPEAAEHPLGALQGNVAWLAHSLGSIYESFGAYVHRRLFRNALARVYPRPLIQAPLPSTARLSLRKQPKANRYCLHLLYAPPIKRGCCEVIEDFPLLRDIPLTVNLPEPIRRVRLPLTGKELTVDTTAEGIRFTLPSLQMHEVVCLEF